MQRDVQMDGRGVIIRVDACGLGLGGMERVTAAAW